MNALEFVNLVSAQLGWGVETNVAALSSDGTKILSISNIILAAMQNDKTWPELRTRAVIEIAASEDIGAELSAVYGNTNLENTDMATTTPFVAGDVGKWVQVGSYTPAYQITTVVDDNNVTLATAWRDENVTLQTGVIGQETYVLPSDMDRLLSGVMYNLETGTKVVEVEPTEMGEIKNKQGMNLVQTEPENFTIHGRSTAGYKQAHFDKISDADGDYTLEYHYQKEHPSLSASTDEILYPDKYIMYIADSVIAKLQRDVENAQQAQQTAGDSLREAMRVGSNPNNSRDRMRLRTKLNKYGDIRRR